MLKDRAEQTVQKFASLVELEGIYRISTFLVIFTCKIGFDTVEHHPAKALQTNDIE